MRIVERKKKGGVQVKVPTEKRTIGRRTYDVNEMDEKHWRNACTCLYNAYTSSSIEHKIFISVYRLDLFTTVERIALQSLIQGLGMYLFIRTPVLLLIRTYLTACNWIRDHISLRGGEANHGKTFKGIFLFRWSAFGWRLREKMYEYISMEQLSTCDALLLPTAKFWTSVGGRGGDDDGVRRGNGTLLRIEAVLAQV